MAVAEDGDRHARQADSEGGGTGGGDGCRRGRRAGVGTVILVEVRKHDRRHLKPHAAGRQAGGQRAADAPQPCCIDNHQREADPPCHVGVEQILGEGGEQAPRPFNDKKIARF